MGSTSPASSNDRGTRSVRTTCGIVGSLFPSSCRGRAEAFARHLHRRLTSISGTDDESQEPVNPNESSWLQNHKNQPVHESQPRHSPESDLYYDFDLSPENDDTESPQEVVSAAELAHLLVNHKHAFQHKNSPPPDVNHENESGYVFSSPLSETSPEESEAYYDPESSETDKTKTDEYYDPATTSGSSEADGHRRRRRGVLNGEDSLENTENLEENSEIENISTSERNYETPDESSSSFDQINQIHAQNNSIDIENVGQCEIRNKIGRIEKLKNLKVNNSSEDSLNDIASSLETTSPSHESLWSTFDESTASLQDEASSIAALPQEPRFSKSYSDSELIPRIVKIQPAEQQLLNERDFTESAPEISRNIEFEFCNGEADKSVIGNGESPGTPGEFTENLSESSTKNLKNSSDEARHVETNSKERATYNSTFSRPGALEVECPLEKSSEAAASQINEVSLKIGNNGEENSVEDVSRLLKQLGESFEQGKEVTEEPVQEDQEDDEQDRPRKLRRCSSLKSGKTPPGTPGRKKGVRFADVLGLDLAAVRTFLDEVPKVPTSAYSDLVFDDVFTKDTSPSLYGSSPTTTSPVLAGLGNIVRPDRMLVPMFQQPGGRPEFMDLVRDRQVCLENVMIHDPITLCLRGTVRVRNLDFHKSVHIRYSRDSWHTFSDLQALYVDGSCDGFSDKFSFSLYCHTLKIGDKLELAVRFQCKGTQFWDNNAGSNYCFQCLPMTMTTGYVPITVAGSSPSHDWQPAFY